MAATAFAVVGGVASAATCDGLVRSITVTEASSCLAMDNALDAGDDNIGNGINDPFLQMYPSYVEIDDTSGTGPYLSGDTGSGQMGQITVGGDLSMYDSLALGLKFGGQEHIIWGVFEISSNGGVFNWSSTQKNGLSHTVLYGVMSEVPVPAAGFLLFAGLGSLALMRRRS